MTMNELQEALEPTILIEEGYDELFQDALSHKSLMLEQFLLLIQALFQLPLVALRPCKYTFV